VGVLSGCVAIFVSSYQDYLIVIIILDVFGAAMALPNRQSKRYPVSTSRSANNFEEIAVTMKEVVFWGVIMCSWVSSFRRFGGAESFHF
jgi:uncharacterized membrane-anchored protein